MDGTNRSYALLDRSVIVTLDLWNVRGKMPFKKYTVRRFSLMEDDGTYLFVLVIRRFGSTIGVYKVNGKTIENFRNDKVRDLYVENGSLMISTRKGALKVTA